MTCLADVRLSKMSIKLIFKEPYSYLLIQNKDGWYLTFFTGGPVDIDI